MSDNTVNIESLSQFVRGDLMERRDRLDLDVMSLGDLFDEWLSYNGILGYSKDIRFVLSALMTSSHAFLVNGDAAQEQVIRELLDLTPDDIRIKSNRT